MNLNDVVQVQNQRGSHANKWDLSGTIVQVLDYNAYIVKMDGSGHVTKRNRQFLRPIIPYNRQLQSKDNDNLGQTSANIPSNDANIYNTGQTADSREATTSSTPSQQDTEHQPAATDKSGNKRVQIQDTLPQSQPMYDKDFDAGLSNAVRNVRNVPH